MASKIVRLICIELMALWLTAKLVAFAPLLAIPLVGASVIFAINETKEIKNENRKRNKNNKRHKKVTKNNS
jgi:hypothetical protein